jgi:hypothetical protein
LSDELAGIGTNSVDTTVVEACLGAGVAQAQRS